MRTFFYALRTTHYTLCFRGLAFRFGFLGGFFVVWDAGHAFHGFSHLLEICEVAIDGREADVGYLVKLAQLPHDKLADGVGWHFGRAQAEELCLDIVDRLLEFDGWHFSLCTGDLKASSELVSAVLFPFVVLLDHREADTLDALISGEAALAPEAFSSA